MSDVDDSDYLEPRKLDKLPDPMTQAHKELKAAAMSWLGALQNVAYAAPTRIMRIKTQGSEAQSEVSVSPVSWFTGVKEKVESSLKRLEAQLAESWNLRRDKRHDTEELWQRYARNLEAQMLQLTKTLLDAEDAIDQRVVRNTQAVRRSQERLKMALGKVIQVFPENGYELGDGELLSLQGKVVDGRGASR